MEILGYDCCDKEIRAGDTVVVVSTEDAGIYEGLTGTVTGLWEDPLSWQPFGIETDIMDPIDAPETLALDGHDLFRLPREQMVGAGSFEAVMAGISQEQQYG